MDKNVCFLDLDDNCESNHGPYVRSNLEGHWVWHHEEINSCAYLWRVERRFGAVSFFDGGSR